jgi:hypothetical protein
VLVPVHPPPDQPAKVDPDDAVAVRVTVLPLVNLAEHVAPQLIPAGLLVTVPVPVPVFDTVSVRIGGAAKDGAAPRATNDRARTSTIAPRGTCDNDFIKVPSAIHFGVGFDPQ